MGQEKNMIILVTMSTPMGHIKLKNRIDSGAFYLHQCEWEVVFPYPNHGLPSDMVGIIHVFQEVGSLE
jgi:hypothetical protein